VRVLDCSNGQDLATGASDDPSRTLIRQVLGAVAQYEKSVLVWRMRAARDRRSRELGRRVEGRKSFDPPEVVEAIRTLRRKRKGAERLSFEQIAARLTERGLRTQRGKEWRAGTVYRVAQRSGVP
jgi:hypothetical protein